MDCVRDRIEPVCIILERTSPRKDALMELRFDNMLVARLNLSGFISTSGCLQQKVKKIFINIQAE